MSRTQHGIRIGLLMIGAAGLLAWLSVRTEVLFADGLRYVAQARRIDGGSWRDGLLGSIDHPAYPLAVAAAHRRIGGEAPEDWQRAAQAASCLAGVLLVIPLYLVALELFGPAHAWLGVLLAYAVPLTGRVLADALSEGTFLLFWTWGLWAALRFLKRGTFAWLPATVGFGALAYLSRPEGLLLPAALVATLAAMPLLRSTRMNWPRWWAAVGFLVGGAALLVGPYVAVKGGLGTKPAIAKLLGTAPRAAPEAVERARPLEPGQSAARTVGLAAKAVFEAIRDGVSWPLLPLALLGLLLAARAPGEDARAWLFLAILGGAAVLALMRLHATGGYCTPRHAMVLNLLLLAAAAHGLGGILGGVVVPGRRLGLGEGTYAAGPAVWAAVLAAFLAWSGPQAVEPVNAEFAGYREAGAWLSAHVPPGDRVIDVSGWALFYGRRPGYTFRNFDDAPGRPEARWVVARESHLTGPWLYCRKLSAWVEGRAPVASFPSRPRGRQARVLVFDRQAVGIAQGTGPARR